MRSHGDPRRLSDDASRQDLRLALLEGLKSGFDGPFDMRAFLSRMQAKGRRTSDDRQRRDIGVDVEDVAR